MSELKGQILPDSEFGDLLTELAKKSETILEIGTWHGQGSTLCLSRGLVRPSQRMWTVDQSKEMWKEARGYYPDEERIRFLRAHTIDILDEVPPLIDLVLFDGNDEQTDGEFDKLFPRILKFVALDDTNERKNRRQRNILLQCRGWSVIGDKQNDRNGWSIFEKL